MEYFTFYYTSIREYLTPTSIISALSTGHFYYRETMTCYCVVLLKNESKYASSFLKFFRVNEMM